MEAINIIDNRQLNDIWLEPLFEQTITVNNSMLFYDDVGNALSDNMSGNRLIYKADVSGGFLFYYDNNWCLMTGSWDFNTKSNMQNIHNNLIIPDNKYVNVKVGAGIQKITSFSGNYTTLSTFNSLTHTMFEVCINGLKTTNYTVSGNVITFTNSYEWNLFNNNLTVVYYTINQAFTGSCKLYFKGAQKTIPMITDYSDGYSISGTVSRDGTNFFQLNGSGTTFTKLKVGMYVRIDTNVYYITSITSDTVMTVSEIMTTSFSGKTLYVMAGINLMSVDTDYSFTPSSTYLTSMISGYNVPNKRLMNTTNSISLPKWIDANNQYYKDTYDYPVMNNSYMDYITPNMNFRIVVINKASLELTIAQNARLSDKSTLSFNTDKTVETMNIEFTHRVRISNYTYYGQGYYGENNYGLKITKEG